VFNVQILLSAKSFFWIFKKGFLLPQQDATKESEEEKSLEKG